MCVRKVVGHPGLGVDQGDVVGDDVVQIAGDPDAFVVVEEGATVGVDRELDLSRGFPVTPSGVTVVPKGTRVTKA